MLELLFLFWLFVVPTLIWMAVFIFLERDVGVDDAPTPRRPTGEGSNTRGRG
jgi:hypothetical protein